MAESRSRASHPPSEGLATRQARRDRVRQRLRRRRQLVTGVFLATALAAGGYLVAWSPSASVDPGAVDTPGPSGTNTTAAATTDPPTEPTETPPVLSLPGDFPREGPGTFRFVDSEGEVLGDSGTLLRFRLAIEGNIDEDAGALTAFVDDTLGAAQGWTAGGDTRLQRVPAEAAYDFTIHLATGGTTAQMCATGGLDVTGPGLPDGGVSCRYGANVVLNLNRWRESVPHFVEQEVPLEVYRQMVLNHEVGHALGLGHEACPGPGEPAPVMQQQTITLDGCEAYAWPYLDGQRYAGEPVP